VTHASQTDSNTRRIDLRGPGTRGFCAGTAGNLGLLSRRWSRPVQCNIDDVSDIDDTVDSWSEDDTAYKIFGDIA
jgi:hypothetical protein